MVRAFHRAQKDCDATSEALLQLMGIEEPTQKQQVGALIISQFMLRVINALEAKEEVRRSQWELWNFRSISAATSPPISTRATPHSEKPSRRAKKAAHEFEIFESELGKASGSLGGFGFNLGAIAKGGSLFTFDLAEAARSAVEVVHKLIESFVDLGSEILKVAGESQDLDLAINLDVGKEGSEKVNKLVEGFAMTSRFSGEQIKKSLLPLIEQGGLGDEKQLNDIATAATDIAARRNSGIGGAQAGARRVSKNRAQTRSQLEDVVRVGNQRKRFLYRSW